MQISEGEMNFCLQEKEVQEEEEEDDTFDMDIKITDPEKIGMLTTRHTNSLFLHVYHSVFSKSKVALWAYFGGLSSLFIVHI